MTHIARSTTRHLVLAGAACLLLSSLGGCAGNAPQAGAIGKVTRIAVDPECRMPARIKYEGPLSNPGFGPGSPLAGPIAQGAAPRESLRLFLINNRIEPGQILVKAMRERIRSSERFELVERPENADAVVRMQVVEYGFEQERRGDNASAFIAMDAQLLNHDGVKVYDEAGGGNSDPAMRHTLSELLADPEAMKAAFREAADKVAADQVDALKISAVPASARR